MPTMPTPSTPLTWERLISLPQRTALIHLPTSRRWFISGQVQTWKRTPERDRLPIKHGLRSYDYITRACPLSDFVLEYPSQVAR